MDASEGKPAWQGCSCLGWDVGLVSQAGCRRGKAFEDGLRRGQALSTPRRCMR